MPARRLVVAIALVSLLPFFTGCNHVIAPVTGTLEWLVGFATDVGTFVKEKATTLSEAIVRAWRAFFKTDLISNVKPLDGNPLLGTYDGKLRCHVEWGATIGKDPRKNEITIALEQPKMVRDTEQSSEWRLAPEVEQQIRQAQEQYLK